jgi:hypothetical protein
VLVTTRVNTRKVTPKEHLLKFGSDVTRRAWLSRCSTFGITAALLGPRLMAQEDSAAATIRSMSWITGAHLPEAWVQNTAGLVQVILDDSRVLRELDLADIEPATIFVAG